MWQGKNKAVTFSFDDGVFQDKKTIKILDKYRMKATFNINTGRFGQKFPFEHNGREIDRSIFCESEIRNVYKNHEIAVHTVNHINLTTLDEKEIISEIEDCRKKLEYLCGYKVVGMAYPCGGVNNDERVAKILNDDTEIKYARTITSTYNFNLQKDLLRFNPTIHINDDNIFDIVEEFLKTYNNNPQLLYIWGHTYEFDMMDAGWGNFDKLCSYLSGRQDVYYGTNKEVLINEKI